MVWFKSPAETLADPVLFLSHVMTCGTVDDLRVVRAYFTDESTAAGVARRSAWCLRCAFLGVLARCARRRSRTALPARHLPG